MNQPTSILLPTSVDAAVGHLDVEAPQDVVLVVVPERQLVGAVRDVLDVEGAVGAAAADVDCRVAGVEVGQRDHGL